MKKIVSTKARFMTQSHFMPFASIALMSLTLFTLYPHPAFSSEFSTDPLAPVLINPSELLMPLNDLSDYFIEAFDRELSDPSNVPGANQPTFESNIYLDVPRLFNSKTYRALNKLRAIFETFDNHGIIATTPAERKIFLNSPKGRSLVSEIESGRHPIANQLMSPHESTQDDPSNGDNPIRVNNANPVVYPSVLRAGNESGLRYKENTWSITYDDGPHADRTPKVLQMLDDHKIKATFFEVTENIIASTDTSKKVMEYEMDLQNHSWSHLQSTKINQKELLHQIHDSTEKQVELLNKRPTLYRLPYGDGVTKTAIRQLIVNENMIHVFWNVDTLDWKDKDSDSVFARTKAQITTEKRGIILFHDIHLQTLKASQMTIEYLQNDLKSNLVTVTEGIDRVNHPE